MINKLTPGHNLMWESSRIMLPEHVALLLQQKEDNKKIQKPIIDEQALMEIGIIVMDSLNYELDIQITIWKNGHFIEHTGIVEKVDYGMEYILLEKDDEQIEHILISDITGAERI